MEAVLIIVIVAVVFGLVRSVSRSQGGSRSGGPGNRVGGSGASERINRTGQPSRAAASTVEPYAPVELPEGLGIQPPYPLQPLVERLEAAIGGSYYEMVKKRMLSANPRLSDSEFEERFFELKRYFLLNAIMPSVPMFSAAVDDVWHEMLMYTKEYQQFCERFNGGMIHHLPHSEPKPMPNEKAWFDWVYAQLFVAAPRSRLIWHGFFRYPLGRELVDTVRAHSAEQLVGLLFNRASAERNPEVKETAALLASKLKEQVQSADESDSGATQFTRTETGYRQRFGFNRNDNYTGGSSMADIAGMMLLFSVLDSDHYGTHMEEVIPEQYIEDGSGFSSDIYGDNEDNGGSDGSDCSSCGSDSGGSDGGGLLAPPVRLVRPAGEISTLVEPGADAACSFAGSPLLPYSRSRPLAKRASRIME